MTAIVASIQERRGTAAAWALSNPVLLAGQIAFTTDVFYGATDQQQFKVGDGVQTWSNLDYMPIGSGSGGSQTLAQTLALGKKTNEVVIESNNAYSTTSIFDAKNESKFDDGNAASFTNRSATQNRNYFDDGSGGFGENIINASQDRISHSVKVFLDSPLIEASQNPTTALGVVTKQYADALTSGYAQLSDLVSIFVTARNNTGSTITKGSLVYVSGAIGQNPTIALAKADAEATSFDIGMASFDIPNNTNVQNNVTIGGLITGLNTSTFVDGDPLFLSYTTPGGFTNVAPVSPNFSQSIGVCLYSHITNGKILVRTEVPLAVNTTLSSSNKIAPTSGSVKYNIDLKENTVNKDATGGYVGLTLFKINFKNVLNTFTSFFTNSNTASRTYTFKDADGTIAFTSDITGINSGTNTGDETASRIATINHGTSAKTTLVDADEITGQDSAASFGLIRTTWTNVKVFLKTYFDTLYATVAQANATHTGDATGATALTVVKIQGKAFPTLSIADDTKYPKYDNATNAFIMTAVSAGTSYITTNRQTASYSLVLTDDAKMIEMNVGTANNLTVPLNATQAFTIGTQILVNQYGAGQTTIVATGGVTLNYTDTLTTRASKSIVCLIKIGTNEWDVTGDTTPLVALMTQTDLDNAMNIDYLYDYVQARGAAFL